MMVLLNRRCSAVRDSSKQSSERWTLEKEAIGVRHGTQLGDRRITKNKALKILNLMKKDECSRVTLCARREAGRHATSVVAN